jgi:hypothetical protein
LGPQDCWTKETFAARIKDSVGDVVGLKERLVRHPDTRIANLTDRDHDTLICAAVAMSLKACEINQSSRDCPYSPKSWLAKSLEGILLAFLEG